MKKTIHIEGFANQINLAEELSGNYDIPSNFGTDEDVFDETMEVLENVTLKIYSSNEKKPLEEIEENHIRQMLGDLSIIGQLDGYSEYTITGFDVSSLFLGDHNVQNVIDHHAPNRYLHVVFEWEE